MTFSVRKAIRDPAGRLGSELPLACTLGPDDGSERQRRWQELHKAAVPTVRLVEGQLQVRYRPGPGVWEELQDLARAEQACCPFVMWDAADHAGQPVLQVTAPDGSPDALAPIAAMFGWLGDNLH